MSGQTSGQAVKAGRPVKVLYAIYNFPEIQGRPSAWGWVKLPELAGMIHLSPSKALDKYKYLSKDFTHGSIAIILDGEFVNCNFDRCLSLEPESSQEIFVPAGWAKEVLAEATGLNARRRRDRIRKSVKRIVDEIKLKHYSIYPYEDDEEGRLDVDSILVEMRKEDDSLRSFYVDGDPENEIIFYDPNLLEYCFVPYGCGHIQELNELMSYGYFRVSSDRSVRGGGVHLLRHRHKR